ncbi:membrane protein [Clostridioides difficile]|nr:membrane protein [Clostridioides difficile]
MLWVSGGLAFGVVIGYYIPFTYSMDYSIYMSVAILAIMDSIFGAIKSNFEDNYDNVIFITGFIGNAILAILLTYIGEKLGISLYYVAVLVFGMRLFNNLSIIRRYIISNIMNKKRKN